MMMFEFGLVAVYLGVGLVAVVALGVAAGSAGELAGPRGVLLVMLWPFLLPPRLLADPSGARGAGPAKIRAASRSARDALFALPSPPDRGAEALERFERTLLARARRIEDLRAAEHTSAEIVRGRLSDLARAEEQRLQEDLRTLEEVAAQLTVLRFAGPHASAADPEAKDSVEELMARVEALLAASEASSPCP